jgi:ribosomal protein S18 acetylase RimI-like enzyme
MNNPSLKPDDDRLTLRGFQDRDDFEIMAWIRNAWSKEHQGDSAMLLDASVLERLAGSPARLCLALLDGEPAGFILILGEGTQQLDEFGTVEGQAWLFVGPTCVPQHESRELEQALVDYLVAQAQEAGIARLVHYVQWLNSYNHLGEILRRTGFRERLEYYFMRLEMTAPPPVPRELPGELELVDFRVTENFDLLWSVFEGAFDYVARDAGSYERSKSIFGSLKAAYFPLCLESASQEPVGTIAMVPHGTRGSIATFGVIPSFQRRGIGSLLMERALHRAWELGVRTVDLSVRVENPQAISIYRRFGFQSIPEQTTIVLLKDI